MGHWSDEQKNKIDAKLSGVKDKDLRFFRIEEFKRNLIRTDRFSSGCPQCKKEIINISEAVMTIDEAINSVGRKRREYDKLISRLSKHMQKEHGYYTPYYFTYLISFYGIVMGSVIGYFLMQLNVDLKLELFCLGFAIGLLPSYVYGHVKDKKIRKEKRLM